jgi:hypothetical protein
MCAPAHSRSIKGRARREHGITAPRAIVGPEAEAMGRTLIANTMIFDGSGAAPFR